MEESLEHIETCAAVFQATARALHAAAQGKQDGATVSAVCAANAGPEGDALTAGPLVCHACALDAEHGLWTVASRTEGGRRVLVAMKGTLSKNARFMERACLYRLELPREVLVAEPSLRRALVPRFADDGLSMDARRAKLRVRLAPLHSHDKAPCVSSRPLLASSMSATPRSGCGRRREP